MVRLNNLAALILCALFTPMSVTLAAPPPATGSNQSEIMVNGVLQPALSELPAPKNAPSALPSLTGDPRREAPNTPFVYREFMKTLRDEESRTLRGRENRPNPRRDEEVLINFDDRQVPSSWDQMQGPTRDEYADLGVHFRGPNETDGGAVVDEDGNFGVNGYSRPNFFGFNTQGQFRNGGTPCGPETIIFDMPVSSVSLLAGNSDGGVITMTAYSADDQVIAEIQRNLRPEVAEFLIDDAGIAYVVLTANNGAPYWIFDDLRFESIIYEGPGIILSPPQLDFGLVYTDCEDTISVRIVNNGAQDLELRSFSCEEAAFVPPGFDGVVVLGSGDGLRADFIFRPEESGDYAADIQIECNAENAEGGVFTIHATGSCLPPPVIEMDPLSFEEELVVGEQSESMLNITNSGEAPLVWKTEMEIIQQPGRDLNGRNVRSLAGPVAPRRDDPIAQYDTPINCVSGMAFDGDLMWGCSYNQNRLVALDLDGNVQRNLEIHNNPLAMAWDGSRLWIGQYNGPTMRTYDLEGQLIETFNLPFEEIRGMGSDQERYIFCNSGQNNQINVIGIEDHQQQAAFSFRNAMGNAQIWGITWVNDHPDGQLWGNAEGRVFEAYVDDEWNVTAVQNFDWNSDSPIGLAHDGENMWHGMWQEQTWYVYDDGVTESRWLTFEPKEGQLQSQADLNVSLNFSAIGLVGGEYEADLHFRSNDPATPDAVVNITLHVSARIPRIVLEPAELNLGYVEPGQRRVLPLAILNRGNADLTISNVVAVGGGFQTSYRQPIVVRPAERASIDVTFAPGRPNAYEGRLTISSNDPQTPEATVQLSGSGVNRAPGEFSLVSPPNGLAVDPDSSLIEFQWDAAGNIDRDTIEYTLYHHIVFQQMDTTVVSQQVDTTSYTERLDSLFEMLGIVSEVEGVQVPVTWWVEANDGALTTPSSDRWEIVVTAPLGVGDRGGITASDFRISSIYPNPFNSIVSIQYQTAAAGMLSLKVFDLSGREVVTLAGGNQPAGYHKVSWSAVGQTSGLYFVQLQANGVTQTQRMLLLK